MHKHTQAPDRYKHLYKRQSTINAQIYLNFTDQADENDKEMKISSLDIELSKGHSIFTHIIFHSYINENCTQYI